MNKLIMTASNVSISELKTNRKYLSVSMRMFSTRSNLNKCAVTEAFIDDIIANKSDYVGMGLFADVPKLKSNDYKHGLTHLYDRKSGTFLADQIGSFYDLEKVEDEFGVSLIGYARIPKRSEQVCSAIEDLYAKNALNFSFEISAGSLTVADDITIIDASEDNELTGMAVVSVPAYPESKALDLVAENENIERMFANVDIQVSEIDIETVKNVFYEWLYTTFSDKSYYMRIILFCIDCVILYDSKYGITYKVEYMIENNEMIIKDFYEVNFVRAEGSEEEMNVAENTAITTEEVNTVAEEVVAEAIPAEEVSSNEVQVAEDESVETTDQIAEGDTSAECNNEDDNKKAEGDAKNEPENNSNEVSELEEAQKKCAELEAKLNEAIAQLDAIRVEKQQNEIEIKKNNLKEYAEREGLDLNNSVVAEAIEACNYEAIFAEVTAKPVENKEQHYFAGYTDMNANGGFGYLLERR